VHVHYDFSKLPAGANSLDNLASSTKPSYPATLSWDGDSSSRIFDQFAKVNMADRFDIAQFANANFTNFTEYATLMITNVYDPFIFFQVFA
jgi:hypothetical protein